MSSSILQRYRHDMNILSPDRIPAINHKSKQKTSNTNLDDKSNREHDLNRPQLISNDLKGPQKMELFKPDSAVNGILNKKNKLKCGSIHEINDVNDEYLDEILHNN